MGKETGEQSKIYKYTWASLKYSEKRRDKKPKRAKGSCLYRLVLLPSLWKCHDHLCGERLLRQFHKVDRWYSVLYKWNVWCLCWASLPPWFDVRDKWDDSRRQRQRTCGEVSETHIQPLFHLITCKMLSLPPEVLKAYLALKKTILPYIALYCLILPYNNFFMLHNT